MAGEALKNSHRDEGDAPLAPKAGEALKIPLE